MKKKEVRGTCRININDSFTGKSIEQDLREAFKGNVAESKLTGGGYFTEATDGVDPAGDIRTDTMEMRQAAAEALLGKGLYRGAKAPKKAAESTEAGAEATAKDAAGT